MRAAFGIDSGSDSFVGTAKGLGSCDISVDEDHQVNVGLSVGTRPTTSCSLLMGHVSRALGMARGAYEPHGRDFVLRLRGGVVHGSKQRRCIEVAEQELCHTRRQCTGRDVRACNGACKVVKHVHGIPTVVEYVGKKNLECHIPHDEIFMCSSPIYPCPCHTGLERSTSVRP